MLQENIKLISETIDPGRLMTILKEVTTFHRIQASPGFRAAAEHMCRRINGMGIKAEVLSYPANDETVYETYPSFQEWSCKHAYCDIVEPFYKRIADFDADNIAVIQKSIPCDYRDKPLEVVMLDKGPDKTAYGDIDLKGKMVFIPDMMNPYYDWAIIEKGALGIITDHVLEGEARSRYDQLDTMRYTSFWWERQDHKAFGFVLTPREGDKLRKLIEEQAAKGETVKVTCFVESELYDGAIEDVSAYLPGETDEEILLSAHLCHPRASANDNASGVSAVTEALRAIKDLIDAGKLPPLKRGIRVLLIPEFTGTYAYLSRLSEEQRKKTMAGINLDMVGGRQINGYGPIVITDLPRSTESFIGDLSVLVLEEIKQEVSNFGGGKKMPMFNSAVCGFAGGSDHQVLSDPSVGIPSVMVGQWPDKFYHTNSDTVEMIDPHVLSKSSTLAAAYAYTLATLDVEDVKQIMNMSRTRLAEHLGDMITAKLRGDIDEETFKAKVYGRVHFSVMETYDYSRFFKGEELKEVEAVAAAERDRVIALGKALTDVDATTAPASPLTAEERAKYGYVPERTTVTYTGFFGHKTMYPAEQWKVYEEFLEKFGKRFGWSGDTMVMFLANGKRTAAEIMDMLYYTDGEVDAEAVHEFLQVAEKFNMIKIK